MALPSGILAVFFLLSLAFLPSANIHSLANRSVRKRALVGLSDHLNSQERTRAASFHAGLNVVAGQRNQTIIH